MPLFTDFLTQHLNKTELLPKEAEIMRAIILDHIAKGEALLLVDGLDEITNPRVRMMFCQELERTAVRYPNTPIVVTSRIVGYRDMPYRMGSEFEHGQIAALSKEDKDIFVRRWALLDGRYPGRNKTKTLAEQVAQLAGVVEEVKDRGTVYSPDEEVDVPESWREALRLLVADCKDDDVDDVLLAIMNPLTGEDSTRTTRPRAVLAALCLADEPNVGEQTAQEIIAAFVGVVRPHDGDGPTITAKAGIEIGASLWSSILKHYLIEDFCRQLPDDSLSYGGLWGIIETAGWDRSGLEPRAIFGGLLKRLESGDRVESISAALVVMTAGFQRRATNIDGLAESLLSMPSKGWPETIAAVWALFWLCECSERKFILHEPIWLPSETDTEPLFKVLSIVPESSATLKRFLVKILGMVPGQKSVITIISQLDSVSVEVRNAAIEELGKLGDKQAVAPLLARLDDQDAYILSAVINALGKLGDKQAVAPLLAKLNDQDVNIRRSATVALGELGDKQAVAPLLTKLNDEDAYIRRDAIEALGKLGDKQAVTPLLAILDDQGAMIRGAAIEALGKLGDKQAVAPLLAILDDQDANIRRGIIEALGMLGDKQTVAPLLAILDDQDINIRRAAIVALGKLGDKQAIAPLLAILDDQVTNVWAVTAAAAALTALGIDRGLSALAECLNHASTGTREDALDAYVIIRGNLSEQMLLSRNFDRRYPWMDPIIPITETRVEAAAQKLGIPTEEARSRYESIAAAFHLKFA